MIKFIASIILLSLPGTLYAEIPPRMMAYACYTCHGEKPAFRSLSSRALYDKLYAFKNDTQPATLMNRISKGYSDTELAAVAQYLTQVK